MSVRAKKSKAVTAGVIGGSGLYSMEGARLLREVKVTTPYGNPSAKIAIADFNGLEIAFLPRHGQGHRISPSEINFRANIYAMKSLGVERLIGIGATGSLKEELKPKDLVIPDQLVDKTRHRLSTFFGDGLVAHVQFNEPFCPSLSALLKEGAEAEGFPAHYGGVYVCMEGPAFSTLAESQENRRMGYSLIGMTASPEVKLAREAEMCYATLAFVTDYDCWKQDEQAVTVAAVIENLKEGTSRAKKVLFHIFQKWAAAGAVESNPENGCRCRNALAQALVTAPEARNKRTVKKLELLLAKYL